MAVPISNVTRRQVYAPSGAGGAGPYAFTFEILANTDIAVYKDDVLLTLTTHYTVTINANGTGSVTITAAGLALAPASPTQYAIVGNRTISRTTDFTTGGDFFANTLNDELDQQTIFAQQNAEGLQRALAAPQTDPTSINMTLPRAALRANKALGFDSSGNPVISDTLGTNRGNWAAGTLYYARDIVKDTTNNNIWQCLVQHTSSGSQPINTNADSAKWSLLVDAASAATSAANAASSASAASTSASNASTSASNASTSASNASTSASNAASSASAASTSASNAAASYDSFDDRYLGPKSSAPSVDNDGNSLLTGALYWDTVINQMRVWSGTAWVNVNASASNTRTAITATAGQTVLTVATYTPGTNTMVLYVNGAKLNASEYTETNATTITLATGLALNDEVEVFSYRVNEIGTLGASSVTIADTGNYYAGGNVEAALQEAAVFTQSGTGAVTRTQTSKLQEFVSVLDFGADNTGVTNTRAACQAAIDAVRAAGGGTVYFPPGQYLLTAATGADGTGNGLIVTYVNANGTSGRVRLVGAGRSTVLKANSNAMYIVRYCDNHGGVENMTLDANSKTGVIGLGVVPQDTTQTTSLTYQTYNVFRNLYISGCTEGIVLRCGPDVGGADSGCWYNDFSAMHIYYCTRGIWLRDCPSGSSGSNRNHFHQIRIGQNTNTGVQIDDGGTNVLTEVHIEGVTTGTSPNATPTGIKIKQTGGSGLDNNANVFTNCMMEAVTRSLENANAYSEFYACEFSSPYSMVLTANPKVMIGGDASLTPQFLPGMIFQANSQVAGVENLAHSLTYGRIQFPATQNPTSNANTLDDYEEGSWTPTLIAGVLSGQTYSIQKGRYVKIGRSVTAWGEVQLSGYSSAGGNYLRIGGLPFASDSSGTAPPTAVAVNYANLTGGTVGRTPRAGLGVGQTECLLIEHDENGQPINVGMLGSRLTTTSYFNITVTYQTAS